MIRIHMCSSTCFKYLHSGVGVLFDPLDDRLVDQLLSLGVETVVGQIGHQILLGHAQNLLLSCHLKSYGKKLLKRHMTGAQTRPNVSLLLQCRPVFFSPVPEGCRC